MMMNAKELALQTYVSQTTVYRLCNKLELSNFSDLKVLIATQKKILKKKVRIWILIIPSFIDRHTMK